MSPHRLTSLEYPHADAATLNWSRRNPVTTRKSKFSIDLPMKKAARWSFLAAFKQGYGGAGVY